MITDHLVDDVAGLLRVAASTWDGTEAADAARRAERRLSEPLTVAIAGRVKAGKSTLLNALVGEDMAPTDAGECTRIVTWYREAIGYSVTIHPLVGEARPAPFVRDRGPLDIELDGLRPEDVDHIEIGWPSRTLHALTLIDTPGLASLEPALAGRTESFLAAGDEESPADAVLYLMRHAHPDDVDFLDAFRDGSTARPNPITTIAVLSRADEIGACRSDAMTSAERAADRYRLDPSIRRLCQTVTPVAGLVAASAQSLREDEFRAFAAVARAPSADAEALLLSAERFLRLPTPIPIREEERESLMARYGMFGIHLSVALIQQGVTDSAALLADELRARTGIEELRRLLHVRLTQRTGTLKARNGLLTVERILRDLDPGRSHPLWGDLERVRSGAHAFTELGLLFDLRVGSVRFRPEVATEAERLLGGDGVTPWERLGLPVGTPSAELLAEARASVDRWRARSESPVLATGDAAAAEIVARSCEGVVAELAAMEYGPASAQP